MNKTLLIISSSLFVFMLSTIWILDGFGHAMGALAVGCSGAMFGLNLFRN